jgi:uncharacterized protein YcaQ
MLTISIDTARRFILGKQGLWPGRRWRGIQGTEQAIRGMEYLQLDPLQIVARSQDITLHSRVLDYTPGLWEVVTYQRRKFFDWGGWLAVRPMDELPHWRVAMRRERNGGPDCDSRISKLGRDHADAITEMRAILRDRGVVNNRGFEMATRTRTQSYRGRKDSALALYYLWRTGEVMTHHRENFERVYALTESVAPAHLIRQSDEDEADRFLIRKEVSFSGLSRLNRTSDAWQRDVPFSKASQICQALLADGDLIEVQVDGWKAVHYALGSDAKILRDLSTGRVPKAWTPLDTATTEEVVFLAPLEHVSARGRAKAMCGRYTSLNISVSSATTPCRSCGAIGSSRASTAGSIERPTRSSSWACGWRIRSWARMRHLQKHWPAGSRASSPFSARASWKPRRFASRCCAEAWPSLKRWLENPPPARSK